MFVLVCSRASIFPLVPSCHAVVCARVSCSFPVFACREGNSGKVCVYDTLNGSLLSQFGKRGPASGELDGISGMRFSPDGAKLLVAEAANNRISMFNPSTGAPLGVWGVGSLDSPRDVVRACVRVRVCCVCCVRMCAYVCERECVCECVRIRVRLCVRAHLYVFWIAGLCFDCLIWRVDLNNIICAPIVCVINTHFCMFFL